MFFKKKSTKVKLGKTSRIFRILSYVFTIAWLLALYFPIYWMFVTLTKDPVEASSTVPSFTFTVPNDYQIALDTTGAEGYVGKSEEEQEQQFQYEALDILWMTMKRSLNISANSIEVVRVENGVILGKAKLKALTYSTWWNKTELDEEGNVKNLLFADDITENLITNWYEAYINKDGKYQDENGEWKKSSYQGYAEKYGRLLSLLEEDGYSYGIEENYKTRRQSDKSSDLSKYLETALGYNEESNFLAERQRIRNVTGELFEVSYRKNFGGIFNAFVRAIGVYASYVESLLGIALFYWNSIKLAAIQVFATCLFTAACSYAMACLVSKRTSQLLFYVLMVTMMIPSVTNVIAMYNFWLRLDLKNTVWPFFFMAMGSPWWIIIFRGVFGNMARELREAAKIDGAGEIRIFFQIMIPLAQSMLIVLGLQTFVSSWNSYFWEKLLLEEKSMWNLTLLVQDSMKRTDTSGRPDVGLNMAVALIAAVPTLFVFSFCQKYLVQGLTFDGLKE